VDKTLAMWDAQTGERVRQFKGNGGIVNSVAANRTSPLLASASDDGFVKVWDVREKHSVANLGVEFPMTAVEFSHDGSLVFGGGVDNIVRAWDIRKRQVVYECKGHEDTITSLRTSPDGNFLLSNSMDNTLRIWDVKPFASATRFVKSFEGAPHGFEKYLLKACWSPDESFVASGAADRTVVVWNVRTKAVRSKLAGHKGVVTQVDWSSKEPILASSSTDKNIFLGELDIE
jgi:Prp8 binding protein